MRAFVYGLSRVCSVGIVLLAGQLNVSAASATVEARSMASPAPRASAGNDVIRGGAGSDKLSGQAGNDFISGGAGSDLMSGGSGRDTLSGGSGNDVMSGGSGQDTLGGGSGNDVMSGGSGKDKLDGGSGSDVMSGGSGSDVINGGAGNDVIRGGTGADTIICGPGHDVVYASANDKLKNCGGDTVLGASAPSASPPAGPPGSSVGATYGPPPPNPAPAIPGAFVKRLGMPARFQWNANYGYCGETSFIAAGMMFGQYTSQWTARALASPGKPQTWVYSQLLLGTNPGTGHQNSLIAAEAMKLDAVSIDQVETSDFISEIKAGVAAGDAVVIGVYENSTYLPDVAASDTYDHIVPVMGFGSNSPISTTTSEPGDTIQISDNALYSGAPSPQTRPYYYTYGMEFFQNSRPGSALASAGVYSLPDDVKNYGTKITGVADTDGVTIPVSLSSDNFGEGHHDGEGVNGLMSNAPAGFDITLTATAQIPDETKAYKVYLYTDFADVPDSQFNSPVNASKASQVWTIPANSGSTWTTTISANSRDTRVFRAVPA